MNVQAQTMPTHAVAAVTHPNPYPFYAHLVAEKPLYYDEALNLWVASSASVVTAVLTNALCRVRPAAEPVPATLLGSPAATIFQSLVRMNDGANHHPVKQAVSSTLESTLAPQAIKQSRRWAQMLSDEMNPTMHFSRLTEFAFQLPVYVVGSLLGIPDNQLQPTALWMSDFVRCLAPTSSPEQIEQGKLVAGHLFDLFHSVLSTPDTARGDGLLATLNRKAKLVGGEEVVIANGIGFLSQAYEATAGLIGNTLLALASNPTVHQQVQHDPDLLSHVIQEVLRYDPPVQNTRRFMAQNGMVAGQEMKEDDSILVLLAAANWDPSANPSPERFDIFRKERKVYTFGAGAHTCPGQALAVTIAQAGVEQLIASGVDVRQLAENVAYRASANTRIPLFCVGEE